jgi:HlyD family secretion protein
MRRLIILSVLLCVAACTPDGDKFNGYVEGEFLRIGPTSAGMLATLSVERGQKVEAGQELFKLDLTRLEADRLAAEAELTRATATWTNLTKGARPSEVDVILKQRAAAQADLVNAEQQWKRIRPLADVGAVSKAEGDQAEAAYKAARAHVAELSAQVKTANLGAREDEIVAAQAAADAAEQKLKQIAKLLEEATPKAPVAGQIEDTYFRPGEFVNAGAPVVSLLPPENVKIRFFVKQEKLPQIQLGQVVQFNCDGCTAPVAGKITFIATQAEYTPPVIYSVGSREKLVFMVEAKPDTFDPQLRPGLPVDITLGK